MDSSIRISFVGDILVYGCQNKICQIGKNNYDYSGYVTGVKDVFNFSDYCVGSLETPFAGRQAGYTCENTSFNTPDDFLSEVKKLGIDLLTTANNHALDRGKEGLARTIEVLDRYGFDHTGTSINVEDKLYFVKLIHDVKVAFISFTYGTNSMVNKCFLAKTEDHMVNLTRCQDPVPSRSFLKRIVIGILGLLPLGVKKMIIPTPKAQVIQDCVSDKEINSPQNEPYIAKMKSTIMSAKAESDITIFCLHSGGQFNNNVGGYTKWLIDEIVDCGVDAVVCNHTHTPLPIEQRPNGCVVAYSLGNFAFTPGIGYYVDGVGADKSIVLHIDIDKNKKKLLGYSYESCRTKVREDGFAFVTIDKMHDE